MVIGVIAVLAALIFPAVQAARESARQAQCRNHLKQLGLALHNYHDTFGVLPFGCGPDRDGGMSSIGDLKDRRYSAQSQLLPFLEQQAVFDSIDFRVAPFHPYTNAAMENPEVFDRPELAVNGRAATTRLAVFLCPSDFDRQKSPWGPVNYRVSTGSDWSGRAGNGMFGQASRVRFGEVHDGLSNTAMCSERARGSWDLEAGDPVSDPYDIGGLWTETEFRAACDALTPETAAGYDHDDGGGQTWLEGNMTWTRYNHVLPPNRIACINGLTWDGVIMPASSRHSGGVNLVLGDGAVRFVTDGVDATVWRAIGTIAKGEAVDF